MNYKIIFLFFSTILIPVYSWRKFEVNGSHNGKPCVNSTVPEGSKVVNCQKPLFCTDQGYCACISAGEERVTMFDEEMQTCLLVPFPGDNFRCITDAQCHTSSFGRYSRCNLDIGKCECHAPTTTTELRNDICYIVRPTALSASFPSCQYDSDCFATDLGQLTRCNSLKCECYDAITNGKSDVGYYQGQCVYTRQLNMFCDNHEQCKVVHEEAECLAGEAYLPGERTCQCVEGKRCDGNSAGGGLLVVCLTTMLMGIVAWVIV